MTLQIVVYTNSLVYSTDLALRSVVYLITEAPSHGDMLVRNFQVIRRMDDSLPD